MPDSSQIDLIKNYFVNKLHDEDVINSLDFIFTCKADYDQFWIRKTHIFSIAKFRDIPSELIFIFNFDNQLDHEESISLRHLFLINNDLSLVQNDDYSLTINGRLLDFRYSEEREKIYRSSRSSSMDYASQFSMAESTEAILGLAFKPNKKVNLKFTSLSDLNELKMELGKSVSRFTALKANPEDPVFKEFKKLVEFSLNETAKTQGEIPEKAPYLLAINTADMDINSHFYDCEEGIVHNALELDESGTCSSNNISESDALDSKEEEEMDQPLIELDKAKESDLNRKYNSQFITSNTSSRGVETPSLRLPKPVTSFNRGINNSSFHVINTGSFEEQSRSHPKKIRASTWMTEQEYQQHLNKRHAYRSAFKSNLSKISTFKDLKIRVLSWNINNKIDSSISIDDWILPKDLADAPPDIFVFGFQEVDLSFGSVVQNKTSTSLLEDRWIELIESSCDNMLNKKYKHLRHSLHKKEPTDISYVRLKRVRLAGILLIIYISDRLQRKRRIFDVACSSIPTGFMKVMGNKGAVAIRFNYYNSSFCFVNCHLAAGEGNIELRKQDVSEILRKLTFNLPSFSNKEGKRLTISDHDYLVFFGDLNFRLNTNSAEEVLSRISHKDYRWLVNIDEIRTNAHELTRFGEAVINFPPTYKYIVGTHTYDTGEKGRIPAYCDRILYQGEHISVTNYRAHNNFITSDHKPISAMINIGAYRINRNLFDSFLDKLIHRDDLEVNKRVPQANVTPLDIMFGDVEFFKVVEKEITITNTGQVDLECYFRDDTEIKMPDWLIVSRTNSVLRKGESTTISIKIGIKDIHVQQFNRKGCEKAFLVLKLQDGGDIFISIVCNFKPTCFGLSLKMLNRLGNTPVGDLTSDQFLDLIKECDNDTGSFEEEPLISFEDDEDVIGAKNFKIPKEIYRMSNFIVHQVKTAALFDRPPTETHFSSIQETLNKTKTSEPFHPSVNVHTMIAIFNIFLSTIEDSIIPFKYQQAFISNTNNVQVCVEMIKVLPIPNQNLVCYLLEFLRYILDHSMFNGSSSDMLAKFYAEIFFKGEEGLYSFDKKVICLQQMIDSKAKNSFR